MHNYLRSHRPTATTLVAWLALLVALGGTSYAAVVLTGANIKDGSLTTRDVRNRSLLAKDFASHQLPAGARGATGAAGASGTRTLQAFTDNGLVFSSSPSTTFTPWPLTQAATFTQPAGGHVFMVGTANLTFPAGVSCEGNSASADVSVDGRSLLSLSHYTQTGEAGQTYLASGSGALPPVSSPTTRTVVVQVHDYFGSCDVAFSQLHLSAYLLG